MNGKNRRVRGCWSRGRGVFVRSKPPQKPVKKPLYDLPYFSTGLKSNLSATQLALTVFFETYSYIDKLEEYSYGSNTPFSCINLRQSHFTNGTVRITKPGIYILREDISFEPNASNDFMPTGPQIASGQYPVGADGAYHLGFFAAVTIETTEGVILDLNGHTIKQTQLHNLQQRFYANIEMASAPFIPNQGPGSFSTSSTFKAGEKVLVKNGKLGLSSHHGIHGNAMKSIILQNIVAEEFEVAGIALNGGINSIFDTITVKNTSLNIRVLSTYSQSRFIRSFLQTVKARAPATTFNGDSIDTIISAINAGLESAKNSVLAGNTPANMFGNPHFAQGYDGNVYGIVLNVNGVVVNDFIKTRPAEAIGNQHIYLQNITISNIISRPVEIISISPVAAAGGAYGGGRQVGPAGDVLAIKDVVGTTARPWNYAGNLLSNAQMIIGKNNSPKIGTTNITAPTIAWGESDPATDLHDVMDTESYYFVAGGDSMGHAMKGNIGLFISAGENIRVNGFTINTVTSKGSAVGPNEDGVHQGGDARGVIVTGSSDIDLDSSNISNVTTENTDATQQDIQVISSTTVKKDGTDIS